MYNIDSLVGVKCLVHDGSFFVQDLCLIGLLVLWITATLSAAAMAGVVTRMGARVGSVGDDFPAVRVVWVSPLAWSCFPLLRSR